MTDAPEPRRTLPITTSSPSTFRALLAGVLLSASAFASNALAAPESVCGQGPSGVNDCPWYQVEIVIFRNDSAAARTSETLAGDAEPVWPANVATLLPAEDPLRPRRTAELQALWQSAGQRPVVDRVVAGLDVEQERLFARLRELGLEAQSPDLGFLDDLADLEWVEPATAVEDEEDATDYRAVPDLEPTLTRVRPEAADSEPPEEAVAGLPRLIPMSLAFREVPPNERLLNAETSRLQRNRDYTVLSRLAWRQPFAPNQPGLAQLVYTGELEQTGPDRGELLIGSVTVDLRRFLHAHIDLYYRDGESDRVAVDGGLAPLDAPAQRWVHVQQSRRMRSGELHYLDHPRIGAIIRIERFDGQTAANPPR